MQNRRLAWMLTMQIITGSELWGKVVAAQSGISKVMSSHSTFRFQANLSTTGELSMERSNYKKKLEAYISPRLWWQAIHQKRPKFYIWGHPIDSKTSPRMNSIDVSRTRSLTSISCYNKWMMPESASWWKKREGSARKSKTIRRYTISLTNFVKPLISRREVWISRRTSNASTSNSNETFSNNNLTSYRRRSEALSISTCPSWRHLWSQSSRHLGRLTKVLISSSLIRKWVEIGI